MDAQVKDIGPYENGKPGHPVWQILSQKWLKWTEMEDKWRLSAVSDHILIYPWQNIQKLFQILE
jgi:hypothetical protein